MRLVAWMAVNVVVFAVLIAVFGWWMMIPSLAVTIAILMVDDEMTRRARLRERRREWP